MKTATLTMRIEEPLKEQAKAIFEQMGLSTSQAVALFLSRVVAEKRIPFSVCVPNAETARVLREMDRGIGVKRAADTEALFALLEKEED